MIERHEDPSNATPRKPGYIKDFTEPGAPQVDRAYCGCSVIEMPAFYPCHGIGPAALPRLAQVAEATLDDRGTRSDRQE